MPTADEQKGEPAREQTGPSEERSFSTSRRFAGGAGVRAIGEVVAKLANVVFFIVLARKLGEQGFGDFIFGITFSTVLMLAAGFGTDELLAREVARDKDRVHGMFRNVLGLKAVLMVVLLGVMAVVVSIGNYSAETEVAVLLIGVGTALEYLAKTVQAIFQAYERMQYTAASLIIQRTFTATIGTIVVLEGGGLVPAAAVMAVGGLVGLATSFWWLHRSVIRPRGTVDRSRWGEIAKAGAPLGVMFLLYVALIKLDATMLSFLNGGDNKTVGQYGAAYRLVDATMFLSWSFGAAILPWFATHRDSGPVSLARGYELGLKVMVTILLPIGITYTVFASQIIDLLYGSQYAAAVGPLRLLGAMTILFGINTFVSIVLIARDRPSEFTRPAVIVLVQNIVFNLILIPRYGASGAAFNAVLSGVLLALLTVGRVGRRMGSVSFLRATAAPIAAGASMAGLGLLLVAVGVHWVAAAVLSTLAFAAVFLAVERAFFRDDFSLYAGALRFRERFGRGGPSPDLPAEVLAEGRLDL
jgi:O-antigen/teichoic acid export membrane protein